MKDRNKLPIVQNVRISEELENELQRVSDTLELAKQDLIRLTMRIGLRRLEEIEYDLARAVLEASSSHRAQSPEAIERGADAIQVRATRQRARRA